MHMMDCEPCGRKAIFWSGSGTGMEYIGLFFVWATQLVL